MNADIAFLLVEQMPAASLHETEAKCSDCSLFDDDANRRPGPPIALVTTSKNYPFAKLYGTFRPSKTNRYVQNTAAHLRLATNGHCSVPSIHQIFAEAHTTWKLLTPKKPHFRSGQQTPQISYNRHIKTTTKDSEPKYTWHFFDDEFFKSNTSCTCIKYTCFEFELTVFNILLRLTSSSICFWQKMDQVL